jgi:hypothetical protein
VAWSSALLWDVTWWVSPGCLRLDPANIAVIFLGAACWSGSHFAFAYFFISLAETIGFG